jgi:hypothetical protein
MRYGKSPADYKRNVVDIAQYITAKARGFAPHGTHQGIFKGWAKQVDRRGYNYKLYSKPMLLAMWSRADEEVQSQVGQGRAFAMELSGYNAIKRELDKR